MEKRAVSLFYCCTSEDAGLARELDRHLAILKRNGIISTWTSNLDLSPGHNWYSELEKPFDSAQVILFLISADFIDHIDVWDRQIIRAMDKHAKGEARVIPILLRPCLLDGAPFANLSALPANRKFISSMNRNGRDEAWTTVAKALQLIAENLTSAKTHSSM